MAILFYPGKNHLGEAIAHLTPACGPSCHFCLPILGMGAMDKHKSLFLKIGSVT